MPFVPKFSRFLLLVPLLILATGSEARHAKDTKEHASSGTYVGVDACVACHDEQEQSVEATAHRKTIANKEPAKNGCESCHGPGSEHINGNGDPGKIFRFGVASSAEINWRCEACHSHLGQNHGHAKLSCLDCHSAHHARQQKSLLVKSVPELCSSCHS
jgi:predicted CXXCH cytochrome family protein